MTVGLVELIGWVGEGDWEMGGLGDGERGGFETLRYLVLLEMFF